MCLHEELLMYLVRWKCCGCCGLQNDIGHENLMWKAKETTTLAPSDVWLPFWVSEHAFLHRPRHLCCHRCLCGTRKMWVLAEVRSAPPTLHPPLTNTFSLPAFVTLSCSSDVTGQYGQTSVLECKVSTSEEVENPEITWVSWKKEGVQDSVLLYRRQDLEAKEGYSFGQQSWKKSMDVSLRIENTTVKHEGKYRCQVGMSSGKADGESRLHVTGESLILMAAQLLIQGWPKHGGCLGMRGLFQRDQTSIWFWLSVSAWLTSAFCSCQFSCMLLSDINGATSGLRTVFTLLTSLCSQIQRPGHHLQTREISGSPRRRAGMQDQRGLPERTNSLVWWEQCRDNREGGNGGNKDGRGTVSALQRGEDERIQFLQYLYLRGVQRQGWTRAWDHIWILYWKWRYEAFENPYLSPDPDNNFIFPLVQLQSWWRLMCDLLLLGCVIETLAWWQRRWPKNKVITSQK